MSLLKKTQNFCLASALMCLVLSVSADSLIRTGVSTTCIDGNFFYPQILQGKTFCPLTPRFSKIFITTDRLTQFAIYEVTQGKEHQVLLTSSGQFTRDFGNSGFAQRDFKNNLLKLGFIDPSFGTPQPTSFNSFEPHDYFISTGNSFAAGAIKVRLSSHNQFFDATSEIEFAKRDRFLGREVSLPAAFNKNFDESILKTPYRAEGNFILLEMVNPIPHEFKNAPDRIHPFDASTGGKGRVNGTFAQLYAPKGFTQTGSGSQGKPELVQLSRSNPPAGQENFNNGFFFYQFTFEGLSQGDTIRAVLDGNRSFSEFFSGAERKFVDLRVTLTPFNSFGTVIGGDLFNPIGQVEENFSEIQLIQLEKTTKFPANKGYVMPDGSATLQISIKSDKPVAYDRTPPADGIRLRLFRKAR